MSQLVEGVVGRERRAEWADPRCATSALRRLPLLTFQYPSLQTPPLPHLPPPPHPPAPLKRCMAT